MKRIQSIAAIALLAAASAHAQMTYDPAVPRGIPESSIPASRELAQPNPPDVPPQSLPAQTVSLRTVAPVVPKLVTANARHQRDSDARRCLQLTSNKQIARCAERYRTHVRGHVTKTKASAKANEAKVSAKPTEAQAPAAPGARANATAVGKADLSKAAPPSKPIETAKIVQPATPAPSAADKPSATPKTAAVEKPAAGGEAKPPKWTDNAKGILKKQGDHLPD